MNFYSQLQGAFGSQNSSLTIKLLERLPSFSLTEIAAIALPASSQNAEPYLLRDFFKDMLRHSVQWVKASRNASLSEAFQKYLNILKSLRKVLDSFQEIDRWIIPVFQRLLDKTYSIFRKVKAEIIKKGQSLDQTMKNLADLMRKFFSWSKIKQPSKVQQLLIKKLMPKLINLNIGIYLSINNYNQLLKKYKEESQFEPSSFDLYDRNQYYFRKGKFFLTGADPVQAEKAFSQIKSFSRPMLKYIIPCKISLGYKPSQLILSHCTQYKEISKAIFQGNMNKYQLELETNKHLWINRRIFILMRSLRNICLRNLIKKVQFIAKSQNIQISLIAKAFSFSFKSLKPQEEVLCEIQGLIFQDLIKGQIWAKDKKRLVLKPGGAFPKIKAGTRR